MCAVAESVDEGKSRNNKNENIEIVKKLSNWTNDSCRIHTFQTNCLIPVQTSCLSLSVLNIYKTLSVFLATFYNEQWEIEATERNMLCIFARMGVSVMYWEPTSYNILVFSLRHCDRSGKNWYSPSDNKKHTRYNSRLGLGI